MSTRSFATLLGAALLAATLTFFLATNPEPSVAPPPTENCCDYEPHKPLVHPDRWIRYAEPSAPGGGGRLYLLPE